MTIPGQNIERYMEDEVAFAVPKKRRANDSGDPGFEPPQTVKAHVDRKSQIVRNARGEEKLSKFRVITTVAIPIKARVWPDASQQKDLERADSPINVRQRLFPAGRLSNREFHETFL